MSKLLQISGIRKPSIRIFFRKALRRGAKVGGGRGISPRGGVFSIIEEAGIVSVRQVRSLGDDVRVDFVVSDVHGNS